MDPQAEMQPMQNVRSGELAFAAISIGKSKETRMALIFTNQLRGVL
jgi:hypothetical protein